MTSVVIETMVVDSANFFLTQCLAQLSLGWIIRQANNLIYLISIVCHVSKIMSWIIKWEVASAFLWVMKYDCYHMKQADVCGGATERVSERQIEETLTCAVRQTAYMLVSICIVPG